MKILIPPTLLALALSLATTAAHAQQPQATDGSTDALGDSGTKQEAAHRFERAIKLYEEGDYVLALAEFERVYELVPDYRVLYNIGQVSMQLGRYARALRTLREYLARGAEEIPQDRRSAVQSDIQALEARTASLKLTVQPANAEIIIDGIVVGKAPLADPVVVDVGERTVQARLAGYATRSQTLTLAVGDRRELELALEPQQSGNASAPRSDASDRWAATPPPPTRSAWVWVGWSATGALAASSAVSFALGASAASDLDTLRSSRTASRTSLDDAQERAKTRLLVADVLGAAAVVVGATTLYFHLSGPSAREQPKNKARLALDVLPTGMAVRLEH